jgi:hypothetical protein
MVPYVTGCEYISSYPKKLVTCHHVIGWNLLENGAEIEFRHKCAQSDLKSQPTLKSYSMCGSTETKISL